MRYRLMISILLFALISFKSFGQKENPEPWSENQLMLPADLAKIINDKNVQKPIVFNVGPAGKIKGSIEIGPTSKKENLDKLKEQLSKLPKDANIVIYCGCCPFEHCPNIRPALKLLNEMKFKNQKLLSLQKNLMSDWISKDYPMEK